MDPFAAIILAADGAAVTSGAYNAAWLLDFASSATPPRRNAAVALAVISAGTAVQAAFSQALFSAQRLGLGLEPFFEPGPWLASRLMLLAGTLLISMLILRRPSR